MDGMVLMENSIKMPVGNALGLDDIDIVLKTIEFMRKGESNIGLITELLRDKTLSEKEKVTISLIAGEYMGLYLAHTNPVKTMDTLNNIVELQDMEPDDRRTYLNWLQKTGKLGGF